MYYQFTNKGIKSFDFSSHLEYTLYVKGWKRGQQKSKSSFLHRIQKSSYILYCEERAQGYSSNLIHRVNTSTCKRRNGTREKSAKDNGSEPFQENL